MADDGDSIFAKAGFELPGAKPAAAPEKAAPGKASPSMFEAAGFKLPTGKAEAAPKVESEYPKPFEKDFVNPPIKSELQKFREVIDPATLLGIGAKNAAHDTLENAVAGADLAKRGIADIYNRNYLPTMPSTDPRSWSPGGILKTGAGAMGVLASPVTGPANALVARPVTELTGNPVIGDRAGFVASSIVPVRGVPKTVNALAPETKAVDQLVNSISAANVPEAVAQMRANPRLTFADTSDPVRLRTQGLMAGGTPDVQDLISRAVKERASTRLQAADTAFTEAMGPTPDVPAMIEGLKDRARKAGREAIQPALESAKPVDVSPVIAAIDEKLKPGVNPLLDPGSKLPLSPEQLALARLKQKLTTSNGETLFDAKRLHEVQSEIGDEAFQLQKSQDPKDRRLGSQLRSMNEKLIDQIDEAAGGAYRPARAKFKDAKDISAAAEAGFDTLKNRGGLEGALEDSPQAFRKWMADATPEEVVARRLTTRADIHQKINSVKNGALAGQNITAIPYNQEKLTALFGEKEAGRLIRVMQDAKREADTNAAIYSGSKTAETTKAAKDIEVRKIGGGNPLQSFALPAIGEGLNYLTNGSLLPGAGAALAGAGMLAHRGLQKIGQMHDIAKNFEFARNALATGPTREAAIEQVLSHPSVIRELQKRSNALTSR